MRPPLYGPLRPFTRRLGASVLASQAPVIFFGAVAMRALSQVGGPGSVDSTTAWWLCCAVAVLCAVGAGMLRRPWGVTLGWGIQVACVATAVVLPAMAVVGLIFGGLWWASLVHGSRIDTLKEQWASAEKSAAAVDDGNATVEPPATTHV